MKKLLIFDFDGVIVDTFPFAYEISKRLGSGSLTEGEYRNFFNGNIYNKVDKAAKEADSRIVEITPFFNEYIPKLLETRPIVGMPEALKKLKADGYHLVIVSSTMDAPIEQYLTRIGIRDCFDRIYGASTHKQKTEKLKMALKDQLVDADDAIFITDTLGDIREANHVGISSIGVNWGYHPEARLREGRPMAIAYTPQEIEELIK